MEKAEIQHIRKAHRDVHIGIKKQNLKETVNFVCLGGILRSREGTISEVFPLSCTHSCFLGWWHQQTVVMAVCSVSFSDYQTCFLCLRVGDLKNSVPPSHDTTRAAVCMASSCLWSTDGPEEQSNSLILPLGVPPDWPFHAQADPDGRWAIYKGVLTVLFIPLCVFYHSGYFVHMLRAHWHSLRCCLTWKLWHPIVLRRELTSTGLHPETSHFELFLPWWWIWMGACEVSLCFPSPSLHNVWCLLWELARSRVKVSRGSRKRSSDLGMLTAEHSGLWRLN